MTQPNSASLGTPPGGAPVLEICVPLSAHIEFDTIGGLTFRVFNPTPTLLAALRAALGPGPALLEAARGGCHEAL